MLRTALALLLALGPIATVVDGQVGSIARAQKLDAVHGGFPGALGASHQLGITLAPLGDLNGDGVADLATATPGNDDGSPDGGAVWVLFLASNGTVASATEIATGLGGFTGTWGPGAYAGNRLAALGDLDGDGRTELAVSTETPSATWVLFLNPDGTVASHREIRWDDPAYGGAPFSDFRSGLTRGLAGPGDLDGDGVPDLVTGAPGDDDGDVDAGAIWILHLGPDGTARSSSKISQTSGGFTGNLSPGGHFGTSVFAAGDLDGNGHADLVVEEANSASFGGLLWILYLGAGDQVLSARALGTSDFAISLGSTTAGTCSNLQPIGDLDGDGREEFGAGSFQVGPGNSMAICFLASDGTLLRRLHVFRGRQGMPADPAITFLGSSFAPLGDLDGDGLLEVAVGDPGDSETSLRGGAIWVLSLRSSALIEGAGVNPVILTQNGEPRLGQSWQLALDCGAHAPGAAFLSGWSRRRDGLMLAAGELLIDPTSQRFFFGAQAHAGNVVGLSLAVPSDVSLVNVQIYSQGACGGAPGLALGNALGSQIGR